MQETNYHNENGVIESLREFFHGDTDEDVHGQMKRRLKTLEEKGHTLVRQVKIGRNDKCPCESGKKFKHCCIENVQIYE